MNDAAKVLIISVFSILFQRNAGNRASEEIRGKNKGSDLASLLLVFTSYATRELHREKVIF